jgi:hypothetical protein
VLPRANTTWTSEQAAVAGEAASAMPVRLVAVNATAVMMRRTARESDILEWPFRTG